MTIVQSEGSSVDRAGAAQGLSELLSTCSESTVAGILDDFISKASAPKSFVREGVTLMLYYLPGAFKSRFQPYIPLVVPPILLGLADDAEPVRDAAMRAAQGLITFFARSSVSLLVPAFQKGFFDDNWRIRQSSVQLLGDLLHKIIDDQSGADKSQLLAGILGEDQKNLVLASLYMARSDVNGIVRQIAVQVWKSLVSNTPRTLKEVMAVTVTLIVECLASGNHDKQHMAAMTLGELVRKLGERIVPEVIPILERGLLSEKSETRLGVCIGLNEVMRVCNRPQVVEFSGTIIPAVRLALCDKTPEVRVASAKAFDTLCKCVGDSVVAEIVPVLIDALGGPNTSNESNAAEVALLMPHALDALREVMAVRSQSVFPVLLPHLTSGQMTISQAKALQVLVPVAGPALGKYLATIVASLLVAFADPAPVPGEVREAARTLLGSITGDAINQLLLQLLDGVKSDRPEERRAACMLIEIFCSEAKCGYSVHLANLLRILVGFFNDDDVTIVQSALGAVDAMLRSASKDEQLQLVGLLRRSIADLIPQSADNRGAFEIRAFTLPKSVNVILSVLLHGLMYGSVDAREQASAGIGDLVLHTSTDVLRPSVVQIAGPLIRVVGDRLTPELKSTILNTLRILLRKVGIALKPFLPQLMTSFVKALTDNSSVGL